MIFSIFIGSAAIILFSQSVGLSEFLHNFLAYTELLEERLNEMLSYYEKEQSIPVILSSPIASILKQTTHYLYLIWAFSKFLFFRDD